MSASRLAAASGALWAVVPIATPSMSVARASCVAVTRTTSHRPAPQRPRLPLTRGICTPPAPPPRARYGPASADRRPAVADGAAPHSGADVTVGVTVPGPG